jgi:hypothetical protein
MLEQGDPIIRPPLLVHVQITSKGWGGRRVRTAAFSVRSWSHASVRVLTSFAPQVDVAFASMRGTESRSAFGGGAGEYWDLAIDGNPLATFVNTAWVLLCDRCAFKRIGKHHAAGIF